MFNVGAPEVLVILLVALVVLGPKDLPKAMRSVGNVMAELRRMSSGFQEEIRTALDTPIEADAREAGAKLARTPHEADITETVARNIDPAEPHPAEPDPAAVHFSDGRPVEPSTAPTPSVPGIAPGSAPGTASSAHDGPRPTTHRSDAGPDDAQDPGQRAVG